MKKHYILALALFAGVVAKAQDTIRFESFNLAVDSFWNGSDLSGQFSEDGIDFINNYNSSSNSWDGFSYSNMTDTTTAGWLNQYSCIAGEGANNSATYGVGFLGYTSVPTIHLNAKATTVDGFWVNNSTYGYLNMRDGDGYAKSFGDTLNGVGVADGTNGNDYLKLTTYIHSGASIDSVEFYLADFRFTDSAQDYIVKDWTYVVLPANSNPDSLTFNFESSDNDPQWGMKTPGYFCIDDIKYTRNTVGITDVNNDINVKLFPNPAVDFVNVTLPKNADLDAYSISLLDANGRMIKTISNIANAELVFDISSLNNGTYIVQINTGTSVHSRRLIK